MINVPAVMNPCNNRFTAANWVALLGGLLLLLIAIGIFMEALLLKSSASKILGVRRIFYVVIPVVRLAVGVQYQVA